jgi:hypothetical protein
MLRKLDTIDRPDALCVDEEDLARRSVAPRH